MSHGYTGDKNDTNQGTVARVQGWLDLAVWICSSSSCVAAPGHPEKQSPLHRRKLQTQGTPRRKALSSGREAADGPDSSNGSHSQVLCKAQILVLYSKVFAEGTNRDQSTPALLTVREKDMGNQGDPF